MNELNELREVLYKTAQGIAQVLSDPGKWSVWIIYLLEDLQDKAIDQQAFEDMLLSLRDDLTTRIEDGRW